MRFLSCSRFLPVFILFFAICLPAAAQTDCHAAPGNLVIKQQTCKKSSGSNQQIPFEEREKEKEGTEKESENKTKNKEDLLSLFVVHTLFTDWFNLNVLSTSIFIDGCNPYFFSPGKPLYISTRSIRV